MTTSEPLARLAAELDFIGRRLQVVSSELQHAQLAAMPQPIPVQPYQPSMAPPPMPMPQMQQPSMAMAPPPPPGAMPPPPYVPPQPLPERLGQEGAGSKVLAWVGGSVTLLGIVLLMVLAVQRGWLGPEPRVFVGGGLGLALIGGGLWVQIGRASCRERV